MEEKLNGINESDRTDMTDDEEKITLEGLLEAYYDCRRNKRRTASAIAYEMCYEERLLRLRDRINNRTYRPGRSICFVVTRPRLREVFAADFEDRIVHHWIALRLELLFEEMFTDRTFNCRKGKGQHYGIRMLQRDICECSDGYTRDCWIMKLDLQGFFMSIRKSLLADLLDKFILERYHEPDREALRYLVRTVVMHRPEMDCERHSPMEYWARLAPNKSLFTNGDGLGIAIGNLFSQLFANFLLDQLDRFLRHDLGFRYTGRYVDDFYIVSTDKQRLLEAVPRIRALLAGIGLTLHPRKFYLQHYSKGVEFTGCIVKKDRVYIARRTVKNASAAVARLNRSETADQALSAVNSLNSYLGCMRHCNSYNVRRSVLSRINANAFRWSYIKGGYKSVTMRRAYRTRARTYQRIKDGEY